MAEALLLLGAFAVLVLGLVLGAWLGGRLAEARHQRAVGVAVKEARKSSVEGSRRALTGQVAEKLAPHFPDFPYDPTEVRFLGTPVDYVVFRGLSRDRVEEVVFLEVKSGRSDLTTRERSVRNAVEGARVRWDVYRVPSGDAARVDVRARDAP